MPSPSGSPAPRLSVVIPTFRRPDALERTLAALERQTVDPAVFEVIVVDDPVDDDPAAVASAIGADRRPFVAEQLHRDARGVSSARNAGWRAARAPLVLFLGDDIVADEDLLEVHLARHEADPDPLLGVLGHVRWHEDLSVTPFMIWIEHGIQFNYPSIQGDQAHWGHFYTANVSLKREALERVGGFDADRFPFLYEDLDLGRRLFDLGFRLRYEPRARGRHWHESRPEDWEGRMAATARAERTWVQRYPGERPYFRDLLADAVARPAMRGRAAALLRFVPRGFPWLGPRVWFRADIHFRQRLAPAFLRAWEEVSREGDGSAPARPAGA